MKNISKFIYCLLAFAFVAVSCNNAELKENYTPGEPDVEGCYGIFFPAQDFSAYATLDPKDATVIPVTVKRSVSTGAISVTPEVVCKESGIFTATPIVFEDGQEETTIEVSFPDAEVGKTYSCTIQVTDPQYVSKYSSNAAFVTFSVTRVKWVLLGNTGRWRDDLVAPMYSAKDYPEVDNLEVYEREDKRGYYKFVNPYGPEMTAKIFTLLLGEPVTPAECEENCTDREVIVDATNPAKIYIPEQPLGTTISSADGEAYVCTLTEECGFKGYANYGTLKDGVITFPAKGVLVPFENDYSYYYGNNNGMLRICLPGAVLTDFSISAKSDFTKAGKLPVTFTTGVDVANIRFESFEGSLDTKAVAEKATALAAGKTKFSTDVEVKSATTTVELSYEKTGIYTVVAVSLDKTGAAQKSTSIVVNYVAAGDEESKAVDIKLGINTAEKYRGVNTDNTLEIWAFSDSADIKDAKMGLFSVLDLATKPEECKKALMESKSVGADIIEDINETGFISPVSGLLPGTEYYLLMWASNGYEEDVFISKTSAKTSGKPLPIYQDFSIADIDEDLLPDSSEGYFGKYNLYGVNMYGDLGLREYLGKVTIQDSEIPDAGPDEYGLMDEYMEICGIASNIIKSDYPGDGYEVNDTVTYDFYGGVFYDIADQELGKSVNDAFYIGSKVLTDEWYTFAGYPNMLLGGFVLDGYIAICSSGLYSKSLSSQGYGTEVGYLYTAYSDEAFTSKVGNLSAIGNILLVDETKDDNGLAPNMASTAVATRLAEFNKISRLAKEAPANLVETPKGRMRSIIDAVKAESKSVKVFGKPSKAEGYNAVSVKTDFQVASNTSRTVVDRSSLKANGEVCRVAR